MQFAEVEINGVDKWCLVMTKWEATAFVVVGKNRKAPDDEQAIRFGCYNGRPVVWISDGTQMLYVEPKARDRYPEGVHEVCVPAWSLKERSVKCRVNQMLLFPLGELTVYVAKLKDLADGAVVEDVEVLGILQESEALEWTADQLEGVTALVAANGAAASGCGSWETAGRFGATLAAVTKATSDAALSWVNPPADASAPLVIRTRDELDASTWTVAIMPKTAP